jgi:hypothetical protein
MQCFARKYERGRVRDRAAGDAPQSACTSATLPISEAPVKSGDNSPSEQPCSDSRAALGIDSREGSRPVRRHDAQSIRLGSVHFVRLVDAPCHDRAGPNPHQQCHVRMPLSALWTIPRHGARQIGAPARRAVVEAAVDQTPDAEWPT